jgi:tRNA(Glu) U13 pseudouridine synthase TruD
MPLFVQLAQKEAGDPLEASDAEDLKNYSGLQRFGLTGDLITQAPVPA